MKKKMFCNSSFSFSFNIKNLGKSEITTFLPIGQNSSFCARDFLLTPPEVKCLEDLWVSKNQLLCVGDALISFSPVTPIQIFSILLFKYRLEIFHSLKTEWGKNKKFMYFILARGFNFGKNSWDTLLHANHECRRDAFPHFRVYSYITMRYYSFLNLCMDITLMHDCWKSSSLLLMFLW